MLRSRSLLAAAALSLGLRATSASAQTMRCFPGTDGKDATMIGLQLFGGTYGFSLNSADGITTPYALGNLSTIGIPSSWEAYARFGLKKDKSHNPAYNIGQNFVLNFASTDIGAHIKVGPHDRFRHPETMNWCTNTDYGRFVIRAAVMWDLRYKGTGTYLLDGILSTHPSDQIKTYLIPGTGFPVGNYTAIPYGEERDTPFLQAQGQRFYEYARRYWVDHDNNFAMAFSTFDVVLYGQLVRKDSTWKVCHKDIAGWITCKNETKHWYDRTLTGEIHRRLYTDFRVGAPDPAHPLQRLDAGGVEYRVSVRLDAGRIDGTGANDALVRRFCGTTQGCGSAAPFPLAPGAIAIPGPSDFELAQASCQAANNGARCDSASNPYYVNRALTQRQLDSALQASEGPATPLSSGEQAQLQSGRRDDDGSGNGTTTGGRNNPRTRTAARPGRAASRGAAVADDSSSVPSQVARYCLARAQDDSIAAANGPIEVGTERQIVTTEAAYRNCLQQYEPPASGPPSGPPNGAAKRAAPSPAPLPPGTTTRCYIMSGRRVCVRIGPDGRVVPGSSHVEP